MTVETLLSRCDMVRETGPGKYIARCPSHDDRSPSLSITEADDGRVLLYCHALCECEDVLSAVGLTFSDLYPKAVGYKSRKPPRVRLTNG